MKRIYIGLLISLLTTTLIAQQEPITGLTGNTKNGIQDCATEIEVNTIYYGLQTIIVDSVAPDTAWLRDCTRGGGVETYNINNSWSFEHDTPINLYDNVPGSTDAHWSTEKVYDFYSEVFGVNSFDGNGAKMVTLINFGPTFMGGSFFSGIFSAIGGGTMPFIDLVGHEFTHGLGFYNSGFIGGNEANALSESFCNIIGTAAEFWALPDTASWLFASIDPTKYDMSDPNGSLSPIGTHYPDTYKGNYWLDNGDPHSNAAVQDYCFYLLSEGGNGTNDHGDYYNVDSIGIENARDIFYRALTVYLKSSIEFIDARQATIQSAADLFGECSNEVEQVIHAWYAVGLGPDTYTRDLALLSIVSPQNNCDLSEEEIVEVEVVCHASGCNEAILAGSEIEMKYQWGNAFPVVETWVLDQDLNGGDTMNFSFSIPISIPEIAVAHNLSVWIDYAPDDIDQNNSIEDYTVERKYEFDGNNVSFEDAGSNNDSFYIHAGSAARAEIDTAAKNTGEYGFLMSVVPGKSSPSPIPEDPSLNFEYQEYLISEICFCVDAQDWEHVSLYFDLKQTYSGLYQFIYGNDSTEFLSSMRMLVNGEQFGEQFHPETNTDDPFITYHYSLDQLAGTYFEFCFQSKNYASDQIDNSIIFSYDTDGDNTYLDNILFADEVFTGLTESKTNEFSIYPNPATGQVTISNEQGTSVTEVNIFNQTGQQVLHDSSQSETLDISMLENGLYIIEIISDRSAYREKLIVR